MYTDVRSFSGTDAAGSTPYEFALAANSKLKNVHGCTFFSE